jgi:hypothetical protein
MEGGFVGQKVGVRPENAPAIQARLVMRET